MKRFGQNAEPAPVQQQAAPVQQQAAPVQQQAAPVQQQAAPGTTAGGAVTSRPIQPATGARAQMLQRQQAQNQIPESIDPLVQENTGYDEIERIVSLVHYR
jgi:hypothetical protein